jgi:chaperonin GroEL
MMEQTDSAYDKEKLQERLAKLAGGVAVISIGGISEIEVKEKKDRIVDALAATKAAVKEGIVPGGGIALLRSIEALDNIETDNADQQMGVDIVKRALKTPIQTIIENAGGNAEKTINRVLESKAFAFGYDAAKDEFIDMFEAGIIDPTLVVRTALQDAASVSGLMITTEVMITDSKEEAERQAAMAAMASAGGMGY